MHKSSENIVKSCAWNLFSIVYEMICKHLLWYLFLIAKDWGNTSVRGMAKVWCIHTSEYGKTKCATLHVLVWIDTQDILFRENTDEEEFVQEPVFCVKRGNDNLRSYVQVSNPIFTTHVCVNLSKLYIVSGLQWYYLKMEG